MDPIPQARIVRKAGLLVAPPRAPQTTDSRVRGYLRDGFSIAMGLWPLTAVVLLMIGLLIMAGNAGR